MIPEKWIFEKKKYLKRCIKGLSAFAAAKGEPRRWRENHGLARRVPFETDGHYGVSSKFYVEYMQLCNKSKTLREPVFKALQVLGYSSQMGKSYVRIARKIQVRRFIKEMEFIRPFSSLVPRNIRF